jgi:hypothetical protein
MQATAIEPGAHVRSLNGNYRSHGVGRVQKVRDDICKVEFNPSVFSQPPHRSINYLLRVEAGSQQFREAAHHAPME